MDANDATDLLESTLELLEDAFRRLEVQVPPPRRKPWKDSFVFRYAEQTIQQAIIQKCARTISGLHAISALLDRGLFQEQGTMQRVLDELEEDIIFLSFAIINNDVTPLHREYLQHFYAEEFSDPINVVDSHSSRGMVSRRKIRAHMNKSLGPGESRANTVEKVLAKTYSGFVHAASPHVMDMCAGDPARFDVSGRMRNVRMKEFVSDAFNYFFRALASMVFAARAFGDEELSERMRASASRFEEKMNAFRAQ